MPPRQQLTLLGHVSLICNTWCPARQLLALHHLNRVAKLYGSQSMALYAKVRYQQMHRM
jgi:hypothetical protein